MTAPHKSIQQPNEHIFSYPFLEPFICCQGPAGRVGTMVENTVVLDVTHLNVSFLIFSRTSQGPRATYSKNVHAEISSICNKIFHIRGRRVGSYKTKYHSALLSSRISLDILPLTVCPRPRSSDAISSCLHQHRQIVLTLMIWADSGSY